MGRYDAQKNPLQTRLGEWANKKLAYHQQRQARSIPCHVTKVDKDFVEVQFDTHDDIMTPPTVKMPQSFSPYGREPTQVGDRGYAVPSDYYLGGISGWGGGNTDYYPRGNLSTLSFQPISQTDNPTRDYDQHTIVGGPNGIILVQNGPAPQQQQQQSPPSSSSGTAATLAAPAAVRRVRMNRMVPGVGFYVDLPIPQVTATNGSTSSNGGGIDSPLPPVQPPSQSLDTVNKTTMQIDKNGKGALDGTNKYRATVDYQNKKTTVEAPTSGKVYTGGDGVEGGYSPVMTQAGPSVNVYARIS